MAVLWTRGPLSAAPNAPLSWAVQLPGSGVMRLSGSVREYSCASEGEENAALYNMACCWARLGQKQARRRRGWWVAGALYSHTVIQPALTGHGLCAAFATDARPCGPDSAPTWMAASPLGGSQSHLSNPSPFPPPAPALLRPSSQP